MNSTWEKPICFTYSISGPASPIVLLPSAFSAAADIMLGGMPVIAPPTSLSSAAKPDFHAAV